MLLATAYALLALSVLLIFGWPLLWALPGERVEVLKRPEFRFLAATLVAIGAVMALAPFFTVAAQPGAIALLAAFDGTLNFQFEL